MRGTAPLRAGGTGGAPPPRCADCTQVACALHQMCAGPASPEGQAAGRPRWSRWVRHPVVRHRAPMALALVAALGVAWLGRPWGPLPLVGLVLSAALALWWSAPRSGRPGWPAAGALASGAGLLLWGGGGPWPLTAVAVALLCARRGPAWALGAWVLTAAALLVVALLRQHSLPGNALWGSALGAALGSIAAERRRYAAREQGLLGALADAQLRPGGGEADPPDQVPLPHAGGAPPAAKPLESAPADTRNRR